MPERRRLPNTRNSITARLLMRHSGGELKIYVTVGLYDDGKPGEIFLKADKLGSTVSGLLDALAISMSIGLQNGAPMDHFTSKLINMRFEPEGMVTLNDKSDFASSIVDAVGKWLDKKFPKPDHQT